MTTRKITDTGSGCLAMLLGITVWLFSALCYLRIVKSTSKTVANADKVMNFLESMEI